MASRIDLTHITLGLGVLEIGSYSNGIFQAYRDAGAIKAEGQIQMQRQQARFESGRPLVVLKKETTLELVTLQFTLAEVSVANVKDAIGGGLTTSSNAGATFLDGSTVAPKGDLTSSVVVVGLNNQFTMGGQCDVFTVALRFTHLKNCTTGKRQIFEGYLASPVGNLTLPFRETDWNLYQIDFELLADTTRPIGTQYFQFIDEL
jgi:hypothetical protein